MSGLFRFYEISKTNEEEYQMGTAVEKIVDWLMGKDQRERDGAIFYLKSLLFLILIVVLISEVFWDMRYSIEKLFRDDVACFVLDFSKICIHFFTSLSIISLVVIVVTAIISEVMKKIDKDGKRYDYFLRMRIGAEFRLKYSVEDVLLFLLIAYIFDKNILQDYLSIYSKFTLIVLGLICAWCFLTSSVVGILNRFFMLKK